MLLTLAACSTRVEDWYLKGTAPSCHAVCPCTIPTDTALCQSQLTGEVGGPENHSVAPAQEAMRIAAGPTQGSSRPSPLPTVRAFGGAHGSWENHPTAPLPRNIGSK